jgi:8-oxo-dGTP pyrophosphatase MutT (NUDIX family)
MQVVYVPDEPPKTYSKSIFLAGPTSRSDPTKITTWRAQALTELELQHYDGVVFVPEQRPGGPECSYEQQIEWEEQYLNWTDCILFWVPRDMENLPGLTTNIEWGVWHDSGKVVLGTPAGAVHTRYLRYYADKFNVRQHVFLKTTVEEAVKMVGDGAIRNDGERQIPLMIWLHAEFQRWYIKQLQAGNKIERARVKWSHWFKDRTYLFAYGIEMDMFVEAENRVHIGEQLIVRPDISTVLLYSHNGPDLMNDTIVMIRSFRPCVNNEKVAVVELPGGSSDEHMSAKALAVKELLEETGLKIDPDRMDFMGERQLVATWSAHKSALFCASITPVELTALKYDHRAHGVHSESEHTFIEVMYVREICDSRSVDWSTLGQVLLFALKR